MTALSAAARALIVYLFDCEKDKGNNRNLATMIGSPVGVFTEILMARCIKNIDVEFLVIKRHHGRTIVFFWHKKMYEMIITPTQYKYVYCNIYYFCALN